MSEKVLIPGHEVIKMLNAAEYDCFPAQKRKNANKTWHFNISEPKK